MAEPATRVIGVGASAGGLEALERFFGAVPPDTPFAFIVVQHLSPDHKSLMADILGKRTRLPVAEAHDGQRILPSHVYLVPPRSNLYVEDEHIRFRERAAAHTLNLPVDILFRSLAEQYGDLAVGIVLSGTGSDGRIGIEAIKTAGGVVLAKDPSSARFDGMPLSAVATGLVDAVLAPEEMPGELRRRLLSGNAPAGRSSASRSPLAPLEVAPPSGVRPSTDKLVGRALVVDDDASVRRSTCRLVRHWGVDTVEADSGPEALAILERSGPPDLAICDLAMPGMNGEEVAERIRARWPDLHVLIVTGHADGAVRERLARIGVDVLAKPFTKDSLRAAIAFAFG
jgi:chemotaxis response regulator CheB